MKKISISIVFIIFVNSCYSQLWQFENLVFEGAGIRGIAYSGVIKQLENNGIIDSVKKVGGTSAGAIIALMVSIGYNSNEISDIISNTRFRKFNDGSFIFFGGIYRMKSKFGWYKGGNFQKWLEKIIEDKTGDPEITFEELASKGYIDLYITATCLNKQKIIVFSSVDYPKMKIKDAVRISMSIPLYFEAVFIDSEGKVYKNHDDKDNLDIVVDGGIIGNFPIFLFDSLYTDSLNQIVRVPNYKTLGIRIDSDEQIQNDSLSKELVPLEIENMADFVAAFYIFVLENLNRNRLIPEDWERTISVSSSGISPRIKRLSNAQKEALIISGEKCTLEFLTKNHSL